MEEKRMEQVLSIAQASEDPDRLLAMLHRFLDSGDVMADVNKITYRKCGDGVLHVLARRGHTASVQALMDDKLLSSVLDLDLTNLDGKTALHEACQHGQVDTVRLLLTARTPPVKVNRLKRADWSPAMLAVTSGGDGTASKYANSALEIVKLLTLHGADLRLSNKDGWTALHLATRTGDLEVLAFLARHDGGGLVNTVSKNGRTPLHTACLAGSVHVVEFLLQHDVNVNATDSCGSTPFMDAVRSDSVTTVNKLLEYNRGGDNAVRCNIIDKVGRSVVHVAAEVGAVRCLRLLHELDINHLLPATVAKTGQTPLHLAARDGRHSAVVYILSLLKADADSKDAKFSCGVDGVNSKDRHGRTALFLAVCGQHVETCRELLAAGAVPLSDESGIPLTQLARKEELQELINSCSSA